MKLVRQYYAQLMLVLAVLVLGVAVACKDTVTETVNVPELQFEQMDRMAVPGVNTALLASNRKDAFNSGKPSTDVANFETEITTNVTNLRTAVTTNVPALGAEDGAVSVATLVGIVCPDVVTIDFSQTVAFPNGRQLDDDVMDIVLGLVLDRGTPLSGGGGIADTINANDKAFLGTFPYLASPNP